MQDRTITLGRYTFTEKEHLHKLDDKPLTGVTTILAVLAKPALIQWSANEAVKYLKEKLSVRQLEGDDFFTINENLFALALEEAKYAHRKKKEKAGESGTQVHNEIDQLIIDAIRANEGFIHEKVVSDTPQVQKFIDWAVENKAKFIESEKHVYSESMWVGGILDMVVEVDGKRLIGDIKTSSAIYNEHFYQMAAYDLCMEEMGEPKVDGYLVVNLKKDGKFDLKISENKDINRRAFKACLELYRIINNLI